MGGQQQTPLSPMTPLGEVTVPVGQQRQDPAQQPFFQVVGYENVQAWENIRTEHLSRESLRRQVF